MGKASKRKAQRRLKGSGDKRMAETVDGAGLSKAAISAAATALIDEAIKEDDVGRLKQAISLLASVGHHFIFDLICDVDYADGNGPQERSIVHAAFAFESLNVCEFLFGAMSRYPENSLYKTMVSTAVEGLDDPVTEGQLRICESWARAEFERVDPGTMSPAERIVFCETFGPNALRMWWDVAGERVADVEARELEAEILAPAVPRSQTSPVVRL